MSTRGKWGITRSPNGELAMLWEWPWYWRYPGAMAVLAVGLWMSIHFSETGRSQWLYLGTGGISALIALSFAYELGCLTVVVGFFVGIWVAIKAVFPDVKFSADLGIWLLAAFAYYCWYVANQAREHARTNKRAIDNIWGRLNELDQSREFTSSDLYREIADLRAEIRRLKRDTSDPFGLDP